MLPFPRLMQYANIAPNWYAGSLMAFDSYNFRSTGFIDYIGNNIVVSDTNGTAGTAKISSGTDMKYGKGIEVNFSIIGVSGSVNTSWITNSFTLDFWSRQKVSGYTYYAPMNCLNTFSGPWSANPKFQYINDTVFNGKFMIGTNNGYYQYAYLPWNEIAWHHYCFMYDSSTGTHRFYIDGVLHSTYPSISVVNGVLQSIGLAGDVYKYTPNNTPIVERWRLRSNLRFDISGFDVNTIYG